MAVSMARFRPESPLSNLIADVLRQAAASVLGRPADVGLVNVGGIRNVLTAGNITTQNIYEILPFENSLCVLTLSGADLKELCANIAARGGEGVSGLNLVISADGRLLEARVGGQPVDEGRTYTVGTIDFLAEGNDGMQALTRASQRQCPEGATLRGLFMDYVERQTAAGRKIEARVPVFQYHKVLDDEPVGIVVRTPRILERTGGDKASLGHVALTDDQLPGICTRLVGIGGKVAHHAVHVYHLVDVARNQPVVISLFGKVHIVVIGALVRQLQGTAYIVLDRVLLRGEREEQLVKTPDVFPRLGGAVL